MGIFLLKWGWGIPRKSLWHGFWDTCILSLTQEHALDLQLGSRAINSRNNGRNRTHTDSVKHMILYHCTAFFPLLPSIRCFIYKPKSNICTAVTIQNTTEKKRIISHAQYTTALQPNVLLTGIHRILPTNKRRSAFQSAIHCQGQLHTPQSLSVAATVTAWLLLGSSQKGQAHYACTKNTCYVHSTFVASVTADVFEIDRTFFGVRAQCIHLLPGHRFTPAQITSTLSDDYDSLTNGKNKLPLHSLS
jgi:hypothetical protein